MSNPPAFQFYAAEYLADENVTVMSLEEEGAYWRAVAYCWREGSIPDDDERLSRLLKGASTTILRVVRKCFNQSATTPGRLVHPRLDKERIKQAEWRAKSAAGGRVSGKARRTKKLRTEPPFVNASTTVQPPYEPNTNSSSSSSSSIEVLRAKALVDYVDDGKPETSLKAAETQPETPPGISPEEFRDVWNQNCGSLPRVRDFPNSLRKKVLARIRQGISLETFAEAVRCCVSKPFLRGENDRAWVATFHFLVKNDINIEKAITDPYGSKPAAAEIDKRIYVNARN